MNSDNDSIGLSGKESAILELLLQAPSREMYGLELVSNSAGGLKRGTVYVTLNRMEDKRYIESRLEEREPGAMGLPRRMYRATGYGQRVYEVWQMAKEARNSLVHLAEGFA